MLAHVSCPFSKWSFTKSQRNGKTDNRAQLPFNNDIIFTSSKVTFQHKPKASPFDTQTSTSYYVVLQNWKLCELHKMHMGKTLKFYFSNVTRVWILQSAWICDAFFIKYTLESIWQNTLVDGVYTKSYRYLLKHRPVCYDLVLKRTGTFLGNKA